MKSTPATDVKLDTIVRHKTFLGVFHGLVYVIKIY